MSESSKLDSRQLVGFELAGRYRITDVVEEGGFGVIYKGEHAALKKQVAVKVLKTPKEYSDSVLSTFVENFTLEAQTIARMAHPNIVQVLDFGVSEMPNGERAPWMVMEWLDGKPLSRILRGRMGAPYSPKETLEIIQPVLEALAYAHEQRIAHRDLKPANVMMLETRGRLFPKLLDFGIAKVMEEDENAGSGQTHTRSATWAFSPRYAAPEQLSQARTGPWTDVHAMALIITEMVTGRAAIESNGRDTTQMYSQILRPDRPSPKSKGVQAGPWEAVLTKALALSPSDRYKDAGELLTALLADVPDRIEGPLDGAFNGVPRPDSTSPSQPVLVPPAGQTTMSGAALAMSTSAVQPASSGKKTLPLILLGVLAVGGGTGALVMHRMNNPAQTNTANAPKTTAVQPEPANTNANAPSANANANTQPAQNTNVPVAKPETPPAVKPEPVAQPTVATTQNAPTTADVNVRTDAASAEQAASTDAATTTSAQPTNTPTVRRPTGRQRHGQRQDGLGFDVE